MPSIKDQSTVDAIAREFCSEGKRNKTVTMITIGYDEGYSDSGKGHKTVFGNIRVKEAIAKIDAKDIKKLDLSRESQHLKLQEALKMAKETKNPAAMTSAITEQNRMLGYHQEKAPNAEAEQARAKRLTDEEKKTALAVAKLRTEEEASVVPIRASKTA